MKGKRGLVRPSATVLTDARFCDQSNAAGWAAYIRMDGHPEAIMRYGPFRSNPVSSIEAEMRAAMNGISIARQIGARGILLQSDSMAVVHAIEGFGKRYPKEWRKLMALAEQNLRMADNWSQIMARHVRAHTRVRNPRTFANDWCDRHAKEIMRAQRQDMLHSATSRADVKTADAT